MYICTSKSVLHGVFVWAHRALNRRNGGFRPGQYIGADGYEGGTTLGADGMCMSLHNTNGGALAALGGRVGEDGTAQVRRP